MSDLADRIARLAPEKRAQLEARLAERLSGRAAPPPIPRRAEAGPCALSFAQERLWFLDQLEPGPPVYNVVSAFRLAGTLDADAFGVALSAVVARHQALRTTFRSVDGTPQQVVALETAVTLAQADWASLAEGEVRRRLEEEARRPFDLSRDPLLRATLARLSPQEHILLLVVHHIAADGWSVGILHRELGELYAARRAGREPGLPELPIQYADFALWQRQWLEGEVLERQLAYWKRQLADSAPLEFPVDHPRPRVPTQRGARLAVEVPAELCDALRALSRREGASLFMILLAAFQVLLHRYTGREDIAVGTPVAGRTRLETEGLIGFFVNTLVLRAHLGSDLTFRKTLARVRDMALDAYAHQDVPFERLVEALHLERSLSLTPLFQVMFGFHNALPRELELPGVEVSRLEIHTGTAKFDLALALEEAATGLRGFLEYSLDLFEADTAGRLWGHYVTLLEAAARNPDERISRLPLMTEPERRQILVEWNDTRRPYPQACLHELFEAQAARQPQVTAAVFEGREISYGELDRRANQVAHQLLSLGVGPEALVGICTERSLEMLVGLVGILKAGGAYVPLDPAYPAERLQFMLEDAQVRALLVAEKRAQRLRAVAVPVIVLESAGRGFPEEKPPGGPAPGNLAYVMYTSGSTGKPKGVEIEHRNVVGFLHSFRPLTFEDERRIGTNVASFSFDTSVEEIFAPLCFGGTVHIIRPEHSMDARYFARYLVEQGINFSYIVPDMLERLAGELSNLRDRLKLRCVVTGLAPKRQRTLQAFRNLSSSLRLLNAYGPTEVTYGATAFEFQAASEPDREVPIGRPFANYQVYIVDGELQPVPIGVAGELLIGGVGVARGYWNRPELTAEKFMPDPFSNLPGARLYRSGDLARYRPDGNIEFLGRLDNQVKIRGYRVEPGEIEAALEQHPGVERAVVTARESPAGDQRLVAYVIPTPAQDVSAAGLRSFLRDQLPGYLVPTAFRFLETLPLMVNGKIDWKALPAPDWTSAGRDEALVAPRDALEARLVRIWEKVLGVSPIGIRDSFFDLGGHSLLAVSLFAEMEKAFARRLPLATLFQAPTVEQLARVLAAEGLVPSWSALVPIQPQGSGPPLFCVHAADGQVLLYRDLARHLGPHQPLYGLQAVGMGGTEPPLARIEDMAARYIEEVRMVQPHGPYFLAGYCTGAFVALEMARRLQLSGHRVALLACINTDAGWREVRSFRDSLKYHFRRLSRLGLEQWITYVLWRIGYRMMRLRSTFLEIVCYLYSAAGKPLPNGLLRTHIQELNHRAGVGYVPQIYRGQVTCFQGASHALADPLPFWQRVATGGVEVRLVPGGSTGVLQEPNVRRLAESLLACLEKARTAQPGDL